MTFEEFEKRLDSAVMIATLRRKLARLENRDPKLENDPRYSAVRTYIVPRHYRRRSRLFNLAIKRMTRSFRKGRKQVKRGKKASKRS